MKKFCYLFFIAFLTCKNNPIPDGFVSLEESVTSLLIELRYSKSDNFVGETIDGYKNPKIVLT